MIGSSENRVSYNGNDVTTEFPFAFKILEATDLKLLLVEADGTEKPLTSDYFVDMNKSVVFYPGYSPGTEPPASEQPPKLTSGQRLVIYREVPITQESALDEHWPFNVIEAMADKLTIICQQLADSVSRSFRVSSATDKNVDTTIPVSPGKSFRWSDDAKKLEVTEDPARVLPLAQSTLNKTIAAKNEAQGYSANADAKAEQAANSAVNAAVSETNAGNSADLARAWAESETSPDGNADSRSAKWWANYISGTLGESGVLSVAEAAIRLANTTYSVGNVVYTDSNLSVALKCTTAGTTSADKLDISGNNIGDTVTDGSVVWQVVSRVSDGMPVGFKYFDWVKEIPVGAVGALGVLYNRELYADLWKAAQENKQVITEAEWQALAEANDGNVPWYSDGDGSTTFRVPALKCWFKGASGIEEVGNYLEAGLPNITGMIYSFMTGGSNNNHGALWQSDASDTTKNSGSGATSYWKSINIDASRCSSVYRDDIDTVQPPSLIGIWLIKAYGTVTNVGNADVANVMQAVEQVQTQVGVVEQTLPKKANLGALSMPSDQYISIAFNFTDYNTSWQSIEYTAPCDGWATIYCGSGETNSRSIVMLISKDIAVTDVQYGTYADRRLFLPVKKGNKVEFRVINCWFPDTSFFRFYYAQSEV